MGKKVRKAIFVLLFLTLGVSTAYLTYLCFFASAPQALSGEWICDLDMTGQAAATAARWLQDMVAVSVSLEDMESYMRELTVQIHLTIEPTGHLEGNFYCNVLPESYDACRQAAYEAFAMAFRYLLAERLHMAGYMGSTEAEAVEALVAETFGMSTVSYLMACGPELLPALEDLQLQYDGRGTYDAADGILTRQFDAGRPVTTKAESYVWKGSSLILLGEAGSVPSGYFPDCYPMVYALKQPQNQ